MDALKGSGGDLSVFFTRGPICWVLWLLIIGSVVFAVVQNKSEKKSVLKQTVMTCALKNLKGCLPDREKRRFHTEELMRPIAALAAAIRPKLIIVDSICGDLNFEEGGNPVHTNRTLRPRPSVEERRTDALSPERHL